MPRSTAPSLGANVATPYNTYTPRPQFLPFHNRPHRWATLLTHRRAGKTVALTNDVILAARTPLPATHPDPQYAYVGPTYKQAKRIAWAYLKRYSRPYWAKPPSESELKLTLVNNAVVYCLGADNADSLRGMYLDGVVMDEYAMFKPSVFTQVIRPALSDRNGWAVFSSTPRGRNLFHDQYRRALKDPQRHFLLTLSAATSGIILPQELEDLRKDMDPEEFAQEYLCSFDSALKGAIYAKEVNELQLSGRLSTTPLYDPALDTHFVYDLGFTDSTVRIAWQQHGGTFRIVNVLARSGVDIHTHLSDLFEFKGPIGQIWLPHDARAKNLQTGLSIVEQFVAHGITPRIVPNHHVHDGISAVRRLFPLTVFDATPYDANDPYGDNPTSDLVEAAKQYHREWDEDNLVFKEQPFHDWSSDYMDAMRYMAMAVSPFLLSTRSSDNALQSLRNKLAGPQDGYNLETLHADAATLTQRLCP
jgi:phage terminase large subunit